MNTTDSRPDHEPAPLLGLGSSAGLGAWQPIETAPKDQTLIDVWVPTKSGGVRVTDVERIGIDTWGEFENGNFWDYKPTHWMPRPAPPQSA